MLGTLLLGIAIILILAKGLFFNKNTPKDKNGILILAILLLVLITGCRNARVDYGSDLDNYYRLYERAMKSKRIVSFVMQNTMEPGYVCLNWLLARVIKWPQFILFFETAFCYGITFRFIYKYSEDLLFSILGFMSLGVMQFYLTGFRQSIAIAICLLALEMAQQKKFLRFLLLVLIATTMHQTAIVFLPVYFMMQVKVSKLSIIFHIVLVVIISQFVTILMTFGNDIFERDYEETYEGSSFGGILILLIGAFTTLLVIYQIVKIHAKNKELSKEASSTLLIEYSPNCQMVHLLIFGVGIYVMRFQALIMERVSFYYMPVLFILLPEVIKKGFVYRDRKTIRFLFIGIMLFLTYWKVREVEYIPFWK